MIQSEAGVIHCSDSFVSYNNLSLHEYTDNFHTVECLNELSYRSYSPIHFIILQIRL